MTIYKKRADENIDADAKKSQGGYGQSYAEVILAYPAEAYVWNDTCFLRSLAWAGDSGPAPTWSTAPATDTAASTRVAAGSHP
ncbi:MAG TPA: hypothetical protein VEG44_09715 [Candidatus Acidoferrales bacterium]|nr:hypothetical protein [Candidatus Acidoferrales bacterium]